MPTHGSLVIMLRTTKRWVRILRKALRERIDLVLTNILLRHQIIVLKRSGKRPEFRPFDRLIWIFSASVWSQWLGALEIIQPDTVKQWKRQGWQTVMADVEKNPGGRPPISKEIQQLIRRMAMENPLWEAPRIHGELLILSFQISESSVSRYLQRIPPGLRAMKWRTTFANQLVWLLNSTADSNACRLLYPAVTLP
ncbi:helix-turn-helix domain-containing protein [Magnetococcus sp. PR-3]|uniref:helix-turn-helix domain-containing protein n=1 Tax=Magnetococcus sp. PR-3 TaxID=3120355 RepID=UPI002FCE2258